MVLNWILDLLFENGIAIQTSPIKPIIIWNNEVIVMVQYNLIALSLSSKKSCALIDSDESSTIEQSSISGEGWRKKGMLYLDADESALWSIPYGWCFWVVSA